MEHFVRRIFFEIKHPLCAAVLNEVNSLAEGEQFGYVAGEDARGEAGAFELPYFIEYSLAGGGVHGFGGV